MDWNTTIQQWGTLFVDRATQAEFIQPFEVDKLRLQALGEAGYYTEGQAGTMPKASTGINPTWLLIGGAAVVALLVLSRD